MIISFNPHETLVFSIPTESWKIIESVDTHTDVFRIVGDEFVRGFSLVDGGDFVFRNVAVVLYKGSDVFKAILFVDIGAKFADARNDEILDWRIGGLVENWILENGSDGLVDESINLTNGRNIHWWDGEDVVFHDGASVIVWNRCRLTEQSIIRLTVISHWFVNNHSVAHTRRFQSSTEIVDDRESLI